MIYFTGDTHTDWMSRLNTATFSEQKPFTTLFVCGNHENYDILDSLPVEKWHGGTVHFLRPSVIHLMRGQIFELEGQSFFTFGGGVSHDIADGILEPEDPLFKEKKKRLDRDPYARYRINHVTWWERELPSEAEMQEGSAGDPADHIVPLVDLRSYACGSEV